MNGPDRAMAPWQNARRGLTFVLLALLMLLLGPILASISLVAVERFDQVPARVLLLPVGLAMFLYLAGLIQCAMVPDAQARGYMLGTCAGVGAHVMLGFTQWIPPRIVFTGRATDWVLSHAPFIHALLVLAGILLLVLYVRRIAWLIGNLELAGVARLLTNLFLGWSGAVTGLVLAPHFADDILNILGFMTILTLICLMVGLAFVLLFVKMLALARDVLAGYIDTRSIL